MKLLPLLLAVGFVALEVILTLAVANSATTQQMVTYAAPGRVTTEIEAHDALGASRFSVSISTSGVS